MKKNVVILGVFPVSLGFCGGALRSQMVDIGCHDTDLVGGYDEDTLDAILPRNGFILDTLSINKRKWGYLGCILIGLGP